jgi:hypothetical protein
MGETSQTFVFCSPEIEELLAYNRVDLPDLMSQQSSSIQTAYAHNPAADSGDGLKDPTTVLLASAAVILSLTPMLSRLLSDLTHKNVVVTEMVLVPVEDSRGEVVKDNNGQPILHWKERAKIIESRERSAEKNKLAIEGPFGIKITFDDSKQAT